VHVTSVVEVKDELARAAPWLFDFMCCGPALEHELEQTALCELTNKWNMMSLQTDIAARLAQKLKPHFAIGILSSNGALVILPSSIPCKLGN
jgi:hypothetical protein